MAIFLHGVMRANLIRTHVVGSVCLGALFEKQLHNLGLPRVGCLDQRGLAVLYRRRNQESAESTLGKGWALEFPGLSGLANSNHLQRYRNSRQSRHLQLTANITAHNFNPPPPPSRSSITTFACNVQHRHRFEFVLANSTLSAGSGWNCQRGPGRRHSPAHRDHRTFRARESTSTLASMSAATPS